MTKAFIEIAKVSFWIIPVIAISHWFFIKNQGIYNAKVKYYIYLIIAIRLLVPWNVTLPEKAAVYQIKLRDSDISMYFSDNAEEDIDTHILDTQKNFLSVSETLCFIWVAGLAASVIRYCAAFVAFKRKTKIWEMPPSNELRKYYLSIPWCKKPELFICPAVESPMTLGVMKPKIYLPKEDYSVEDLEMILRHELIHYKRHDMLYKLILTAAKTIHWFNPMVWVMTTDAQKVLEISCDAEVVKGKDMDYRRRYSIMLMNEQAKNIYSAQGVYFSEGKKILKARFSEILNIQKRKKGIPVIISVLILSIMTGCAVKYDAVELTADEKETIREMSDIWADCLYQRNGERRYNMMSEKLREEFRLDPDNQTEEGNLNFSLGYSSPWVESYGITMNGTTAVIEYRLTDSLQEWYIIIDTVEFSQTEEGFVVTRYESTEPEQIE